MIKVELPDRTLAISFSYSKENRIVGYGMDPELRTPVARTRIVRVTWCRLLEVTERALRPFDQQQVKTLTEIAEGHSDCMPPDAFSKDEGRKRSLKAALGAAQMGRAYRTIVWDAYRDRGNPERILRVL